MEQAPITRVILSIPTASASAIKVPVNISDVTGLGVLSAEVVFVCNPSELSIEGFTSVGTLTKGLMTVFNNQSVVKDGNGNVVTTLESPYSKSQAIFAFASATPIQGSGPLFYIKVKNLKKKPAGLMITYFLLNEAAVFGVKPQLIQK